MVFFNNFDGFFTNPSRFRRGVSAELKMKICESLLRLNQERKKRFGMLIVLGWKRDWNGKYASLPDSSQNLFSGKSFSVARATNSCLRKILLKIADFDGAILVNLRGEIVASGVYLENMNPKAIAETLNSKHAKDLSEAFGFAKKVHTRHLVAIATSYRLKGTTVFAVSEEDGSIRAFERGRIIYSTVDGELF